MGSVMVPIQEMVERCFQAEHVPNEALVFVPVTVELPLKSQTLSKPDDTVSETADAKLIIHCKFIPYQGT
jgi:hypothetical protein